MVAWLGCDLDLDCLCVLAVFVGWLTVFVVMVCYNDECLWWCMVVC